MTSCGKDMSKILQEKAVQFSQKGQKYKLISYINYGLDVTITGLDEPMKV